MAADLYEKRIQNATDPVGRQRLLAQMHNIHKEVKKLPPGHERRADELDANFNLKEKQFLHKHERDSSITGISYKFELRRQQREKQKLQDQLAVKDELLHKQEIDGSIKDISYKFELSRQQIEKQNLRQQLQDGHEQLQHKNQLLQHVQDVNLQLKDQLADKDEELSVAKEEHTNEQMKHAVTSLYLANTERELASNKQRLVDAQIVMVSDKQMLVEVLERESVVRGKLVRANSTVLNLQERLMAMSKALKNETRMVEKLIDKTNENEEEKGALQRKADGLQKENGVLLQEKLALQDKLDDLQKENGAFQQEKRSLQQENNALQQKTDGLQKEKSVLQQANLSLQQKLDDLQKKIQSMQASGGDSEGDKAAT